MYVGRDFDVAEPVELQTFGFDFVNDIADGDTIASANWICSVSDESEKPDNSAQYCLVPGTVRFGGTQTFARFQNLLDGVTYIIEAIVVTVAGDTVALHSHCVGRVKS